MRHSWFLPALCGLLLSSPAVAKKPYKAPPPFECPDSTKLKVSVCIDLTGDSPRVYVDSHRDRVILPNRELYIAVQHRSHERVSISLSGRVGLEAVSVQSEDAAAEMSGGGGGGGGFGAGAAPLPPPPPPAGVGGVGGFGDFGGGGGGGGDGADMQELEHDETDTEFIITDTLFAPRQPGEVDVKLTLSRRDTGDVIDKAKVELIVEQTFTGAIRAGVGATFGGAVDGSYGARTVPGSSQAEIAALSNQTTNLDLVIGYAAFFDRGGRPADGCTAGLCLAPYLGISITGQGSNGIELFNAMYAGIEIEPLPQFSIAATVSARRVTRLASGEFPGSPVRGSDDLILEKTTGIGPGIVLNMSPKVLKFGL